MCDLLRPYLEPLEGHSTFPGYGRRPKRLKLSDGDSEESVDDELVDPFLVYKSKGFGKTRILLKAEGIHERPRRFVH